MSDNYRLEWIVEVKETRRATVAEEDLPQPVQYALAHGFELADIACGCTNRHLTEDGEEVLQAAYRALDGYITDQEEHRADRVDITARDVVTFSAVPKLTWVREPDGLRADPAFWVNEHSDRL